MAEKSPINPTEMLAFIFAPTLIVIDLRILFANDGDWAGIQAAMATFNLIVYGLVWLAFLVDAYQKRHFWKAVAISLVAGLTSRMLFW